MKLMYLLEKYTLKFEKIELKDTIVLKKNYNETTSYSKTNVDSHEIIILKIFK